MKKILIISILLFVGNSAFSQEKINWMTWEEAIEANKTEPKKIIVDVYTWWCGWCKRMDQTTFKEPAVVNAINTNYYDVKLDDEQADPITYKDRTFVNPKPGVSRSTHEFAIWLLNGQLSYPKFVVLDEKEQLLQVIVGYKPAADMEMIMKFFGTDYYKTGSGDDFKKSFKSDIVAK